jgi:hypothetical protein
MHEAQVLGCRWSSGAADLFQLTWHAPDVDIREGIEACSTGGS